MDLQIALMLVQDGIVNGAIYALMALALVLVFSVTRVIFIPQGEFVAYAALAMAALQTGKSPALLWMLLVMAALCIVVEAVRQARGIEVDWKSTLFWAVGLPALAALMLLVVKPQSMLLQVISVLLLVTPMGPLIYRLAYRPLADATVLIHGHTHRPGDHALGADARGRPLTQVVLSDWHVTATERRLEVLRLSAQGGLQRVSPGPT